MDAETSPSLKIVLNDRGKPVFEGTRCRPDKIVEEVYAGRSKMDIASAFPDMPAGAIEVALDWDRQRRAS